MVQVKIEKAAETERAEKHEERADVLEERVVCTSCMEHERGLFFLPCRHMSQCGACWAKISNDAKTVGKSPTCPHCRVVVDVKVC